MIIMVLLSVISLLSSPFILVFLWITGVLLFDYSSVDSSFSFNFFTKIRHSFPLLLLLLLLFPFVWRIFWGFLFFLVCYSFFFFFNFSKYVGRQICSQDLSKFFFFHHLLLILDLPSILFQTPPTHPLPRFPPFHINSQLPKSLSQTFHQTITPFQSLPSLRQIISIKAFITKDSVQQENEFTKLETPKRNLFNTQPISNRPSNVQ